MLSAEGRKAKTLEDAERFIKVFLIETLGNKAEHSYSKSYDFDLYLPMLMDWILNLPADRNETYTPTEELEHLYMDSGWDLCQKGLVRPGPRTTNGESGGDFYGKGYTLTKKGWEWLRHKNEPVEGSRPESSQPNP